MIPEKGKTYLINYYSTGADAEPDLFYKGEGTYLGEVEKDEFDEPLYIFSIPDNVLTAMFSEEDIVEEVKK